MRTSPTQAKWISIIRTCNMSIGIAFASCLSLASSVKSDPVIAYDTLTHASGQPIYDAGTTTSPPFAIGALSPGQKQIRRRIISGPCHFGRLEIAISPKSVLH